MLFLPFNRRVNIKLYYRQSNLIDSNHFFLTGADYQNKLYPSCLVNLMIRACQLKAILTFGLCNCYDNINVLQVTRYMLIFIPYRNDANVITMLINFQSLTYTHLTIRRYLQQLKKWFAYLCNNKGFRLDCCFCHIRVILNDNLAIKKRFSVTSKTFKY